MEAPQTAAAAAAPDVDIALWFQIHQLNERYCALLDNDRLEDWTALFTEDCLYEIVPKENADMGLPIGLVHCTNAGMLRDRVVALRHANIYESHSYRHMTSGLAITPVDAQTVTAESSYVVVQTRTNGESFIFQAGRYLDRLVRTPAGWRFAQRRVVYDTSRVLTLLATPI